MKATLSYLLTMLIFVAIMCSPADEQAENYRAATLLFWGGIFNVALVVTYLNTSKKEEKEFLNKQPR